MLEVLCGNKNIQRILLFLFVNGKCYGTQLHKVLKTPLTPVQKALNRLEKGGLIISYFEGKTKVYHFNPSYPLIHEVEQLLKKAFNLLPGQKKKEFYAVKEDSAENKKVVILAFWEKLTNISQLTFHAKTNEAGWNGKGQGEVTITKSPNKLIFNEKGTWKNKQSEEVTFSNVFRWSLDTSNCLIGLEHLRRGPEHPVFLFHLAPTGKQTLASVESHLCEGDVYFGQIYFDHYSLKLNWRVIGPKKNEEIDYYYN